MELHDTIDQLRHAMSGFVDRYNTSWLIQPNGHLTTKEHDKPQQHDRIDQNLSKGSGAVHVEPTREQQKSCSQAFR